MKIPVTRSCGHKETVDFKGTTAAWKDREALLKRLPCNECHIKRLRERVKGSTGGDKHAETV